jgi:hypothetical protein
MNMFGYLGKIRSDNIAVCNCSENSPLLNLYPLLSGFSARQKDLFRSRIYKGAQLSTNQNLENLHFCISSDTT